MEENKELDDDSAAELENAIDQATIDTESQLLEEQIFLDSMADTDSAEQASFTVYDEGDEDTSLALDLDEGEQVDTVFLDQGLYVSEAGEGNFVRWQVEGLYDDAGNLPKASEITKNPPILSIESELGEVHLALTKEFANDLGSVLADVKRAYFSMRAMRPEQLSPDKRSELEKIKDWTLENPIKLGALVVLLAILIFSLL